MSVVGLITEYNPFHNGHLYHMKEAKRITGADTVVVVMSGNFVQRGTLAMMDKYTRTRMALEAGADIVIELPVCYATASAEFFALGAVSILNQLGFVDSIVFGSECGNIELLQFIANVYEQEPAFVTQRIQELLRLGLTYPAARAAAVSDFLIQSSDELIHATDSFMKPASGTNLLDNFKQKAAQLDEILNSPNNILGIEYLRALTRLKSRIKPYTITRIQSNFHSEELSGNISSATAIRKALSDPSPDLLLSIQEAVPHFAYHLLQTNYTKTFPMVPNDLSLLLKFCLLKSDADQLQSYLDVSPDLANRISRFKFSTHTFDELVDQIRSKQYTQTRIQRALLHILLDITSEDLKSYAKVGYTPYARILGLRKRCSSLLKRSNSEDTFTIITKLSKATLSAPASCMLQNDIRAAHLYNLLVSEKYQVTIKDEYTHGLILMNDGDESK